MSIELRSLGRIEIAGPGAEHPEALLSRPLNVAVLAYLLLGGQGQASGALSENRFSEGRARGPARGRESVVTLFWPHASRERGRSSLRVALHALRSHLGPDAIRSRGDDLVVDPDILSCDALAFDDLLRERRLEEALTLYGGDLLPGLRPRCAPRFDAWLADRRLALRRRAAEAAWDLSEQSERAGRTIEAARWARRAAALSPDVEPSARRLMRLLARHGDRVGALEAYDAFVDRWSAEQEAAPSARTRTLAAAIRGAPAMAGLDARPESPTGGGELPADRWPVAGKIAVLPFAVAGQNPEPEHLAAALASEVIGALARISGILVVARPSAERYGEREGRPLAAIGRELAVDSVLDASVRMLGDRIAILARLVDVRSQVPIWAEIYECAPDDLLPVRAGLVLDVLGALRVAVSPEEQARIVRGPTTSPEAYDAYLRGRSSWTHRSKDSVERSIGYFEEALAIDPGFALAQSALADAYPMLSSAAGVSAAEARVRAREAARAALALDPELGEPHALLGIIACVLDGDFDTSEEKLRRACDLSPGYAPAHHWLGALLSHVRRRFDEGTAELEIARQLDPYSPVILSDVGLALMNRGDIEAARRVFDEALALDPTMWRAHYDLGVTLCVAGEMEAGVGHLRRAWRRGAYGADPDHPAATDAAPGDWSDCLERKLRELSARRTRASFRSMETALVSMLLGRGDEALACLRTAHDEGSFALSMGYYPVFAPLETEPGFVALLEEAGIGPRRGP